MTAPVVPENEALQLPSSWQSLWAGRRSRWIAVVAISLALLTGVTTYLRCTMLDPVIFSQWAYGDSPETGPQMSNAWFGADIPLVVDVMTDRHSPNNYRTSRHPLMPIVMYPPVKGLLLLGVSRTNALWIVTSALASAWTALLFLLLVTWGCRILDATVFTVLANISAGAIFWLVVPEVFSYGSVTILLALLLNLWPAGVPATVRHTAAMAISLSMTVTNCLVAIVGAIRNLSLKNLWVAGTSAFFIVSILWAAGKAVFPASDFFVPPEKQYTTRHSLAPTPERAFWVAQSLLGTTMVMAPVEVIKEERVWATTVQRSMAGSGSIAGMMAVVAWLALLCLAGARKESRALGLWRLCALSTAAMIAFHCIFGKETFLYAVHILPLLVVVGAGVTFTRWRHFGLALAGAIIVLGGVNNWSAFKDGVHIINEEAAWARTFPGADPP